MGLWLFDQHTQGQAVQSISDPARHGSNSRVGRSRAASRIRAAWLAATAASPHPPERRSWITLRPQRCGPPRPRECGRLGQRAKANASCRLDRSRPTRWSARRSSLTEWLRDVRPARLNAKEKKAGVYADANRSCAKAHTPFYRSPPIFRRARQSIDCMHAGGCLVLMFFGQTAG